MIKSSQTSRSIHVESGGRRRVIVSVTTRTRAFLSTIDHHFVSLLAHKNCRTTRCFLFRVDCGNACFVWNILRLCITNRLCTYYLFKGGMATRKACKVTHTSVRDKLTRTLSNFWPYTVQKKERDIKTTEINEKTLSVWRMEAQWGRSRATTENRDNTCDTRAKEKESRSVLWLSGYASCLAASKQDSPHPRGRWWARVYLILEWFGPRALSLCSLYVVLPFLDTRWKSPAYLFRYRERASVFLSLSFSVYIVHIFLSLFLSLLRSPTRSVLLLSSLLLHARFASLSSSSSPRLSSPFVHRIQHRDV